MLKSTMPKSLSLPYIRSDSKSLRSEKSTQSDDRNMEKGETGLDGTPDGFVGKSQRHVRFSDSLSPCVCRVCHGGESSCPFSNGEPLISLCLCTGSTGLYHRSCLEKWLSTANTDRCEICKYQYTVERYPKPWTQFLRNPGSRSIRRNMIGDLTCFIVLTPMALASTWLCVAGALAVSETGSDAVAVPGLVSLAVFLMVTYLVWLLVTVRYHYQVWLDWRQTNQSIRLVSSKVSADEDMDDNNNADDNDQGSSHPSANTNVNEDGTFTIAGAYHPVPSSAGRFSEYPNYAFVWETMV